MNSGSKKLRTMMKHVATLGLAAQAGGCVLVALAAVAITWIS